MTSSIKMEPLSRYPGIILTEREVQLIKIIHEFNVCPAKNIHRIYNAGLRNPRTPPGITMRIRKLVKSGMLIQLKSDTYVDEVYQRPSYAYRVGARGFDLLHQENYITEKEADRGKNSNFHLTIPTPHNKTVNTIFTRLFEICIGRGETFESLQIDSRRGDRHEGITAANAQTGYSPIIPDWIYETKDHIICLELDTGTQRNSVINMKFDRYKRVSKLLSKPLVVVFSVGLSILPDVKESRERRIGSLKELFAEHTEWPANFELYVMPSYRTPELLNKLFRQKLSLSKIYSKGSATNWLNYARQAAKQDLSYNMGKNEELNRLFLGDTYDLDIVTELVRGEKSEPTGLLYMEEGSVRSYQKARANMIRLKGWNTQRALYESQVSLLLVYDSHANGIHDVLSLQPLCKMFIVNIEKVKAAAETRENEFPQLLEIVTQYTRNERTLI